MCSVHPFLVFSTILAVSQGFAFPGPFPEGEGPDGTKYKTAYQCEDDELRIACDLEETIQVIRANFGRFSIAICNKHGFTDWSVNCMAPRTIRIMQSSCDGKRVCEIPVNSEIFGDPCPGTHKYVEVHYACSRKFTTTTKRPLPPWFLESGAGDLWSPQKQPSSTLEETEPTRSSSPLSSSTLFSSSIGSSAKASTRVAVDYTTTPPRKPILVTQPTTPVRIPITTPKSTTTSQRTTSTTTEEGILAADNEVTQVPKVENRESAKSEVPSSSKHLQPSQDSDPASDLLPEVEVFVSDLPSPLHPLNHCPPKAVRNIHWNWTSGGEVAIVPCPRGSTGLARWACQLGGHWTGPYPDLSDCRSNAMTNLESRVRAEEPENVIVSVLAKLTRSALFGGDIETAAAIMKTMANRLQYLLQSQSSSFYKKEAYIQEVFQNILRSSSNLLALRQREAWRDLPDNKHAKVVTDILLALEENAFLLADVTLDEEFLEEASPEIVMAISVMNSKHLDRSSQRFVSFPDHKFTKITSIFGDYVELPLENLKKHTNAYELTRAVFFAYTGLHRIMDSPLTFKGQEGYRLNSRVLSAALAKGRHVELKAPVTLTFQHLDSNLTGPVCVFWDFEMHMWSDNGCTVKATDQLQTQCQCNHLTNFALLMREDATPNGGVSAFLWMQLIFYVFLVVLVALIAVAAYKFRAQLSRVARKYFTRSQEKKKGLDPNSGPGGLCPKSQSFYSGVNLVATTNTAHPSSSTLINGKAPTVALDKNHKLSQYLHSLPNGAQMHPSDIPEAAHQSATLRLTPQATPPPPTYSVYELEDGMEATKHLRDSVYMSPQLMNLNNTLRSKKRCQAGHCQQQSPHHNRHKSQPPPALPLQGVNDDSMLPESEVIFRAVSPHGHVYWEIDPKREHSDEDQQQLSSNSDMSSSRQSSSRYSDNHPLIKDSPQHHVLVNPFADVQLLPNSVCSSPTSIGQRGSTDVRFSSLRLGKPNIRTPTFRSTRSKQNNHIREEEIPEQIQIQDIRSIPVNIKSNDYILAKIQSHMSRGSPVDLVVSSGGGQPTRGGGAYHTTAQLDGSHKQRRV